MANNELPKANLGKIIGSVIKGGYQGIKTGYKSYKAASLAEKAAKLKKAQIAARTKKAAETRAANAAKNSKPGTPKPGTSKPGTSKPGTSKTGSTKTGSTKTGSTKTGSTTGSKTGSTKTGTPKGKDPFVKSKARVATENVVGKVIGGAPFYTVNAAKKFLTNKYGVGITLGALTYGAANRWNKTNAPKKVKKYKK